MRVIHDHGRLVRRAEYFHSATHRLQTGRGFQQCRKRIIQRQQRAQRQQQVADVECAHQAAFDFAVAPGGVKADRRAAVVITHLAGFQPAATAGRVDIVFHRDRNGVRQFCQPAAAHVIIGIDDRLAVVMRREQQPFCGFVTLHIAVIIQMVAA